jgi:hypothetical protein
MASTYSTSLKLELIGTGDQSGSWGNTTNNNLGTLLEQAIVGQSTIVMANADYTLSNIDGTTDEARNAAIIITGSQSGTYNVICPAVQKLYMITNNLSSSATAYFKPASGTAISIANGNTILAYCTGTTMVPLNYVDKAGSVSNITGGSASLIPYQTATNTTGFITAPTSNTFLRWNGTAYDWSSSTGSASTISGGTTNQILYQVGAGSTSFITAPSSSNTVLNWTGTAFNWVSNAGGTTTQTLTFNNSGTGGGSSQTFNGSLPITISYNTIGAAPAAGSSSITTTGTVTSGTWSGSFGSVSGANLTNLTGANVTGTVANATTATTATTAGSATTAATCTGNAATATNPQSGGTFITSSNINSQSVNFATSATNATTATNQSGGTVSATTITATGLITTSNAVSSTSGGGYSALQSNAVGIGTSSNTISSTGAGSVFNFNVGGTLAAALSSTQFVPSPSGTLSLGSGGLFWTTVYATNGTINTSDGTQKQQVAELTTAEIAVAKTLKGLIRTFKFNDSVAEKGVNARIHTGVIAQDVYAAFAAQGLDAARYGLFCSDTWYEVDGKVLDEDGNKYTASATGAVSVTRLGIRYDELLAFIIAGL